VQFHLPYNMSTNETNHTEEEEKEGGGEEDL
jgi:hypothetical protein